MFRLFKTLLSIIFFILSLFFFEPQIVNAADVLCPGTCVDTISCVGPISGYENSCGTGRSCCQSSLLKTGSPAGGKSDVFCDDKTKVNTALGCISTDLAGGGLTNSIIRLAIGLGGASALVLMLYGFYVLTTSAGIPDKVKAGQEVITSAVGGLLFIIFAVVLMQLIGVKILNLPGL